MTEAYDQLKTNTQIEINLSNLSYDERAELRKTTVDGPSHNSPKNAAGNLTTVYYLDGDERAAAERFVAENRAALEAIDTSKRDIVQNNVSRDLYDLILHELGERIRTKYETVVLEERPDGTLWLIGRQVYEQQPMRRYSASDQWSARVDNIDLETLYEGFGNEITETDLREHATVSGNVRQLLDYYRVCGDFDCQPFSTGDGKLAVRKHHFTKSE